MSLQRINLKTDYPNANGYGILGGSASEITTAVGITKVTVSNGYWASDASSPVLTGRGFPTGDATNISLRDPALADVATIRSTLDGFTPTVSDYPGAPTPAGSASLVLVPGIYKSDPLTDGITFGTFGGDPLRIELDAQNVATAQFIFISTGKISFTELVSITLTNGAKAENVFWYGSGTGQVSFGGSQTLTNFVGTVITQADFVLTSPLTFNGHIFGKSVQFIGAGESSVILPYNPSADPNSPPNIKGQTSLEKFALLGADDLLSLGTEDFTIERGYWGTATGKTISSTIVAASGDTFSRLNTTEYAAAITQRDGIALSITGKEFSDFNFTGVSTTQTLQPGYYTGTDMRFGGTTSNITITLDAENNLASPFIFYATGDIVFSDLNQIVLANLANPAYIIFYAEGSITFENNLQPPGVFECTLISDGPTTFVDPISLDGRVFSKGVFTATDGTSIRSPYLPPPPALPINYANYSSLAQYLLRAQTAITVVGGLTLTNGYYGVGTTVTGTITSLGNPSGRNDNIDPGAGSIYDSAGSQLDALDVEIMSRAASGVSFTGSTLSIEITPGVYTSGGGMVFTGPLTITLDAQGDPGAQFIFAADTTIIFTNVTNIILTGGAMAENVFWRAGTAITFDATSGVTQGTLIAKTEAITFAGAVTANGRMFAGTAISFDAGPSTASLPGDIPCYLKGTRILTERGYVLVETIKIGDNVATFADIDSESIVTVRKPTFMSCVSIRKHTIGQLSSKSRPILFKAGSLGYVIPYKDLRLSPHHGVSLDKYLREARFLVNGDTIILDPDCRKLEYYHIELESHVCIKAEGVLAESLNII